MNLTPTLALQHHIIVQKHPALTLQMSSTLWLPSTAGFSRSTPPPLHLNVPMDHSSE